MNLLLSFLISLVFLNTACDQPSDYSVAPPAGKATTTDECLAVQWDCADGDSTFTIFHGDVRLLVWPDSVEVTQYLTPSSKRVYIASETSPRFSRFRAAQFRLDGVCGVWSDAISRDDYTRIFNGDVQWGYRGTVYSRLQVSEGGELYQIANINEDGGASYVDFWSVFSRNTKPPSLEGRYYIPLNFDTEVLMDFDRLPNDDRHYLDSPVVSWEGCQIAVESPVSPRVRSRGDNRQRYAHTPPNSEKGNRVVTPKEEEPQPVLFYNSACGVITVSQVCLPDLAHPYSHAKYSDTFTEFDLEGGDKSLPPNVHTHPDAIPEHEHETISCSKIKHHHDSSSLTPITPIDINHNPDNHETEMDDYSHDHCVDYRKMVSTKIVGEHAHHF